jgi:hypothetical protein
MTSLTSTGTGPLRGHRHSAESSRIGWSQCFPSHVLLLTPSLDKHVKSPTIDEALLAFEYAKSQGSDTDSYVSTDTDDCEDEEQCPPFGHNSLCRHGMGIVVATTYQH